MPEVAAHDNRSRGLVKHLRIRMEFRDAVQYLPVVDHNEHPWLLVVGAGSTHGCFRIVSMEEASKDLSLYLLMLLLERMLPIASDPIVHSSCIPLMV